MALMTTMGTTKLQWNWKTVYKIYKNSIICNVNCLLCCTLWKSIIVSVIYKLSSPTCA